MDGGSRPQDHSFPFLSVHSAFVGLLVFPVLFLWLDLFFHKKKKKKDCRDGGGVEFNLFTAENLKGQLFVLICRLRKSKKSTLRKRKLNFKS